MPRDPLLQLGLKDDDARLYRALLPLGEVPLSDVARLTGLHPQIVARLVDRLVAAGLAQTVTRLHRRHVRAEDPREIARRERERLTELEDAVPGLVALQQAPKEALVRVARGDAAVRDLRLRGIEELAKGETYYVIGGSGDRFYQVMGDRYAAVEKLRIKKGIKKRLVTFESQRTLLKKNETFTALSQYRFLPETFPVPTSTNIFGSTVATLIWSADPIVLTVESEEVAESHRHTFESLWKMAKA